jgi:hypothetical protein
MNDLNNPFKLLPVKRLDSLAKIFLLLKGQHVVIRNLSLLWRRLLFRSCLCLLLRRL